MSYQLTYYSNNGKGLSKSGEYTTPGYLEGEIFSTDGYIIYCWNTKSDGTGTVYNLDQYIPSDEKGSEIGGSLYAIWKLKNQGQIRIQNGDKIVDVSDIYDGVYKVAGKNQPYNYITLTLIKNMFNDVSDGGYWKTRQEFDPTAQKPDLIQRETKILVDVYGIKGEWRFERVEEDENYNWNVTAVCQAYNMKSTTLGSLLAFSKKDSVDGETQNITFTFPKLDNFTQVATKIAENKYTVEVPVEYRNRLNTLTTESLTIHIDTSQTEMIEKVIGTGSAVFALISKYCGGYTGSSGESNRIFIDDGFIYDFTNGTYSDVQSTYTQLEIEQIKARTKLPLSGTIGGKNYDAKNVELRPDEFCSTIIKGLGYLSNRYAFFDEDAYFVDYQVGSDGSKSQIIQYKFTDPATYNTAEKMKVDWGGDNSVSGEYFIPEIAGLSSNADQGSQYILQSQKVISENYERTVAISDSLSSISGNDIKYMYRENVNTSFEFDNTVRNFQTSIIALNEIVNWYKPGDAIQYNMSETKKQYTYTTETYNELIQYPAGNNDKGYTGLVLGQTDFRGKVYKGNWDGSAWVWATEADYTNEDYSTLERDARYKVYSVASEIKDVQNDFMLYNTPLAAYILAYPSCMTTYVWGNPAFMDEETQLSDVVSITADSTLDNTSDTQISDNYAAKIVVGNQNLAELKDDRSGYTGLILEKNWDVELYRLAGYDNGVVQAQFNTRGKITAGGGRVMLDSTGMKTFSTPPTTDDEANKKWVTHIDTSGSFKTGNYDEDGVAHVVLNNYGLNILFNSNDYKTYQALNFRDMSDPEFNPYMTIYSTVDNDGGSKQIISYINTRPLGSGSNEKATPLQIYCQGGSGSIENKPLSAIPNFAIDINNGDYATKSGSQEEFINNGAPWSISSSSTITDWRDGKTTKGFIVKLMSLNNLPLVWGNQYIIRILCHYIFPSSYQIYRYISRFKIYYTDGSVYDYDGSSSFTDDQFIIEEDIKYDINKRVDYIEYGLFLRDWSKEGNPPYTNPENYDFMFENGILEETTPSKDTKVLLLPSEIYNVQLKGNCQIGYNGDNLHKIYGKVEFQYPPWATNDALENIVDALISNPTLMQKIKNRLDTM